MIIANCPACTMGRHEQHVQHWGTRPEGAIDGEFCYCAGDCFDTYAESLREVSGLLDDSDGDSKRYLGRGLLATFADLERREVITTNKKERHVCCGMPRDADGFCIHRPYHPIYVEIQ